MNPELILWLYQVGLQTVTLFFMLVGLFGLIVPVFPGLTVMWLAALIYAVLQALIEQMNWVDWTLFALITLLMLGGNVVDNIIIASKMRGRQIPWSSIAVSYAASLILSLAFTPLIGLVAAPLALFGAEFWRLRDRRLAFESARVYMIGWGASFAARFGIGAVMIVSWMLWAWL